MKNAIIQCGTETDANSVLNKPDAFKIVIESDLYFPGSVVKGVLSINTRNTVHCGNLSIKLEGKSYTTSKRNYTFNTRRYAYCKRVLWGEIFTTPIFESIFDIRQNDGECLIYFLH